MTLPRALRPVAPAAALAAVLLIGATGCSALTGTPAPASSAAAPSTGATAPSSAAKTAACTILGSSLQELGTNAQTAYSQFSKDPQSAVTALTKAADQFRASAAKITDPGAEALATKARQDLAALVKKAQNAVEHPITGAANVASGVQSLQADITKIGTYCS